MGTFIAKSTQVFLGHAHFSTRMGFGLNHYKLEATKAQRLHLQTIRNNLLWNLQEF
jgi:hypothetical protein